MRALLLLPAFVLLAAAPARAQGGRCEPLSQRDAPGDAERRALRASIADSLRTEIEAAAREAGVAEPVGLLAIRIRDRSSGAAEVTPLESNVRGEVIQPVLARHAAMLARWPDREPWLHVRLDGPHPAAGAQTECTPAVLNSAAFLRELPRVLSRYGAEPSSPPRVRVAVRMLVSREGEVVFGVVTRRDAGGDIERGVLDLTRTLRFRPATLDGVPVDVWVEQPITF